MAGWSAPVNDLMSMVSMKEINTFIRNERLPYSRWYVGITGDVQSRLFGDHNVQNGYIYRTFPNDRIAREIEQNFHELGCQGSHGGGDWDTKIVYAYLITSDTVEDC